jgi:hypothetical protein
MSTAEVGYHEILLSMTVATDDEATGIINPDQHEWMIPCAWLNLLRAHFAGARKNDQELLAIPHPRTSSYHPMPVPWAMRLQGEVGEGGATLVIASLFKIAWTCQQYPVFPLLKNYEHFQLPKYQQVPPTNRVPRSGNSPPPCTHAATVKAPKLREMRPAIQRRGGAK